MWMQHDGAPPHYAVQLTGLAICGIGIWTFLKTCHYMNILDSIAYSTAIYLFLTTGGLVILTAVLGCCAIPHHRTKLLFCYILLLVLIFLMEALTGVLSYIYQENIEEEIDLNFNATILATYNQDDGKSESINVIQQKGCIDPVTTELQTSLWLICAVALGLSIVQVFGILVGINLLLKLESIDIESKYSPNGNDALLLERQL
ncbi:hypothetical protein NQ317_014998 [Molorchus minor]|uniref:Tetraspanin n=1 Tax=Molorchus minor TaxID=1323400 RepID=A0ABQ9ISQ4_9CUCU|nr:hypothetical protein NQ317_014998 [Molorchus minor]